MTYRTPQPGAALQAPSGRLRLQVLSITLAAAAAFGTMVQAQAQTAVEVPKPEGLKGKSVPQPSDEWKYIINKPMAIALGKALFWDIQVGSDGKTACASCHFAAGADNRSRNAVSPGLTRVQAVGVPNPDTTFQIGGPNHQFTLENFPFHKLSDPNNRNSSVLRSVNDVASSAGVFNEQFVSVTPGASQDVRAYVPDAVFNHSGQNTRKVEPRNTPTVINAVFNFRNFWDGRAQYLFNGVNPFGGRDASARVFKYELSKISPVQVLIDNSSLASQASGPPLSDFEMSAGGRTFMELGRRMLKASPLALQKVSTSDSVLGIYANPSGNGINPIYKSLYGTYEQIFKLAFGTQWWYGSEVASGAQVIQVNADGSRSVVPKPAGGLAANQYTQMEANFSLMFSLAVQAYEATLVSDDSPFDQHMIGLTGKMSTSALQGMSLFFSKGKCANCHGGPEFTNASTRYILSHNELMSRMTMGNGGTAVYDEGFYNISVTKTLEDVLVGANDPFGLPLSLTKLAQQMDAARFKQIIGVSPNLSVSAGERVAVTGSAKAPTVRNVELTAPYFHNGGAATLRQVVQFYNRGGNFASNNIQDLDADIQPLGLSETEIDNLVDFLKSLTDDRVRLRKAPFDHPSLPVPVGHQQSGSTVVGDGTGRAVDLMIEVPATGRDGVPWAQQLPSFLDGITPDASGAGTGLLGSYYGSLDHKGGVMVSRVEPVDYKLALGASPGGGLPIVATSVRWEGTVKTGAAGSYQFQTRSDNGIRVWIDGQLVIDNWYYHLPTDNTSAVLNLAANRQVPIVIEYQQWVSGAVAQLRWKVPGSTSYVTVPTAQLYAPASYRAAR